MSKSVDTTAISTYFAAGITRKQYVLTAAVFVALALFAMFFVTFVVAGAAMCIWGAINWGRWLALNLAFLFVNLAIAGICFILSSSFAARGYGLAAAIAAPVVMTILEALSAFWTGFKYFTLYGHIHADEIAAGHMGYTVLWIFLYSAIAVSLAAATVYIYKRKQFSI
jgi:hypothetical protein